MRLHCDYAVEPGAHAGSSLERLSVEGAQQLARSIRPRGLSVALRYGREALDQSVIEIDTMVAAVVRSWIASTGLKHIPRVGAWEQLARWASACAMGSDRQPSALFKMP